MTAVGDRVRLQHTDGPYTWPRRCSLELAGNLVQGGQRQTWVMRRCVGLVALAFVVAACSGGSDVVDGPAQGGIDTGPPYGNMVDSPAQEDILDEPPYGAGVVVGETYDYVMYVHCGVRWTRIDGVWWKTAPLGDGVNPPDGWGNPYDAGTLTVIDETTAEYTGGPDVTVRFKRTDATEPPFMCD